MTTSLQSELSQISEEFAQKVFDIIRSAFVVELGNVTLSLGSSPALRGRPPASKSVDPAATKGAKATKLGASKGGSKRGRLERRSAETIAAALEGIVALLVKKPGIGSEEIQKTLGLARNEIARPISNGLETRVLVKEGEKRATKYFAASAASAAKAVEVVAPAKKAAKKVVAAKKPVKKPAKKAPEAVVVADAT
jgi:hypothetical protein